MEYTSFSNYAKELFGTKVYRLSLQSGCGCPNRDGRVGVGGCTFCSEGGSGEFASAVAPIGVQIEQAMERVRHKLPDRGAERRACYLAYFQSYTNTYGDRRTLLSYFREALAHPQVVGLSIATRPDCLEDEMITALAELAHEYSLTAEGAKLAYKPVWIELGLQTIHDETAKRINRGYSLAVFTDAYRRLAAADLPVIIHVILGLPGENRADMLATIEYLAKLEPVPAGIKLALLHILRNTALGRAYEKQPFALPSLEEYCDLVVNCLKRLPPQTVVHRITGDGPKRLLLAPLWSADKKRVLNALQRAIREA